MNDEEDIYFVRNSNNITDSDSISALNENVSTYMGVKTIPEGTIPDNNTVKKKKNQKSKKKKNIIRKTREKSILFLQIHLHLLF